jgi:hypothetical protein
LKRIGLFLLLLSFTQLSWAKIRLKWKPIKKVKEYRLIIVDNKNKLLLKTRVKQVYFDWNFDRPGSYMWKVAAIDPLTGIVGELSETGKVNIDPFKTKIKIHDPLYDSYRDKFKIKLGFTRTKYANRIGVLVELDGKKKSHIIKGKTFIGYYDFSKKIQFLVKGIDGKGNVVSIGKASVTTPKRSTENTIIAPAKGRVFYTDKYEYPVKIKWKSGKSQKSVLFVQEDNKCKEYYPSGTSYDIKLKTGKRYYINVVEETLYIKGCKGIEFNHSFRVKKIDASIYLTMGMKNMNIRQDDSSYFDKVEEINTTLMNYRMQYLGNTDRYVQKMGFSLEFEHPLKPSDEDNSDIVLDNYSNLTASFLIQYGASKEVQDMEFAPWYFSNRLSWYNGTYMEIGSIEEKLESVKFSKILLGQGAHFRKYWKDQFYYGADGTVQLGTDSSLNIEVEGKLFYQDLEYIYYAGWFYHQGQFQSVGDENELSQSGSGIRVGVILR